MPSTTAKRGRRRATATRPWASWHRCPKCGARMWSSSNMAWHDGSARCRDARLARAAERKAKRAGLARVGLFQGDDHYSVPYFAAIEQVGVEMKQLRTGTTVRGGRRYEMWAPAWALGVMQMREFPFEDRMRAVRRLSKDEFARQLATTSAEAMRALIRGA